ncbi:DUF4222 domain-containing protein [Xenorhabdus hominickii]|uniref:DUF4222 domain-containing protein n=1 Tax=Xenorhabdus hominickii TaxID=351679 RepID=A0A2G0QGS1_XENHO|nr:DUF4222 domain-containing protein [Xenorhabdus hominickii]AOM42386.1 DUF4222 domain-containing protein [Xenorhabdus hominickii]PHM58398.1 hypothetical protein Xhom_01424 [Xenorhabdus hominickii]
MGNENIKKLDRRYRDKRGIEVHVIGWDVERRWVVFMRKGYEHPCVEPLRHFKEKYTRMDE